MATLEKEFAELEAKLEADLAASPIPSLQTDDFLRERLVILASQSRAWLNYFRTHGGIFTARGNIKKGVDGLLRVLNTLDKLERSLALGPLARAQAVQAMSAGRRDATDVAERIARMRAKQAAAVAQTDARRQLPPSVGAQ